MSHEVVEIPVSKVHLYEAVAVFLSVLAYPDDEAGRVRFGKAYCREAIRISAEKDADFAWTPQLIRPVYFLMNDDAVARAVCAGGEELAKRKTAVYATLPLFEEREKRKPIVRINTRDDTFKNDADGRALLKNNWDGRNDTRNNLRTRFIKPSLRVIHAAHAYWTAVIGQRLQGLAKTDEEAEHLVRGSPALFSLMVQHGEAWRIIAPSIAKLQVEESRLIEFRLL